MPSRCCFLCCRQLQCVCCSRLSAWYARKSKFVSKRIQYNSKIKQCYQNSATKIVIFLLAFFAITVPILLVYVISSPPIQTIFNKPYTGESLFPTIYLEQPKEEKAVKFGYALPGPTPRPCNVGSPREGVNCTDYELTAVNYRNWNLKHDYDRAMITWDFRDHNASTDAFTRVFRISFADSDYLGPKQFGNYIPFDYVSHCYISRVWNYTYSWCHNRFCLDKYFGDNRPTTVTSGNCATVSPGNTTQNFDGRVYFHLVDGTETKIYNYQQYPVIAAAAIGFANFMLLVKVIHYMFICLHLCCCCACCCDYCRIKKPKEWRRLQIEKERQEEEDHKKWAKEEKTMLARKQNCFWFWRLYFAFCPMNITAEEQEPLAPSEVGTIQSPNEVVVGKEKVPEHEDVAEEEQSLSDSDGAPDSNTQVKRKFVTAEMYHALYKRSKHNDVASKEFNF